MKDYFSSDFTLGILGGGQLGKMLMTETRKYDIGTAVLDPNPEAPGRIGCNTFITGDLKDYETVLEFGRTADLLTIEIETVNVEALEKLEQEGKKIYPTSQTLRIIQDKGIQKSFYEKNGIPTAPFERFNSKEELLSHVEQQAIKLPFVWKSTTGGYDGKGVRVIRKFQDLEGLPDTACIAENLIPFKNELAVMVARSASGEVQTYPVVEMEFHPEANQVEYVLCPARVEAAVAEKARLTAATVSQAFEHVGLLAVEMFQTEDDQILVNEVAPRPHNSGHYSIEASFTSQFEQHLRAILDLPLGSTQNKTAAVMVNLVGEEGHIGNAVYENIDEIMKLEGVTPHIYGKKQTRPFRKMGHVTVINQELLKARETAEKVKEMIRVISKK